MISEVETQATLSAYYRETWWTVEGARLKLRRLKAKGLPDFKNWRFITVTCEDRDAMPVVNYRRGVKQLAKFTEWWASVLSRHVVFCWKMELHEDGYPHWHLLLDYTKKIPREFLDDISKAWGLGRVNVKRVSARDIHYVFKYITKGGDSIPDWVLDYKGFIRCFQASHGFYTNVKTRTTAKKEQLTCRVKFPLRHLFAEDECKGLLVEFTPTGARRVSMVRLHDKFRKLFMTRVRYFLRLRVPLPYEDRLIIGQHTVSILKYEHRNYQGFGHVDSERYSDSHGEPAVCTWTDLARDCGLAA